ncbi:MAG: hypothetical protein LC655_03395, partial [Bacteroidales bacterium]|nr:hypothetical protein [Bacteroidales bacterium]
HHIIDPRMHQGTASPYADSQTFTPGEKMSQEEIIDREKEFAKKQLDKLLSAEASRLNYPLKYDTSVEEDSLDLKLRKILTEDKEDLCVASLIPDNSMISDLDELLKITEKVELPLLLVPPGYKFIEPSEIALVTDYSKDSFEPLTRALRWFESFHVTLSVFDIVEDMEVKKKENLRELWEQGVSSFIPSSMALQTNILIGKKNKGNIEEQIMKSTANLAMVPGELFKTSGIQLKKGTDRKAFLRDLEIPVLIY